MNRRSMLNSSLELQWPGIGSEQNNLGEEEWVNLSLTVNKLSHRMKQTKSNSVQFI